MTTFEPRRWRRMQPILDRVLDLLPAERAAWLDEACAADAELRADIDAVLRADAEAGGVLEAPTGAFLSDFLREIERERGRRLTLAPDAAPAIDPERVLSRLLLEGGGFPRVRGERRLFLPGSVIAGRYRIVSLLGRGGMGNVYRADDLKLGQAVALKFLPEEVHQEPLLLRRLLDEANLARQVGHPNVCRVYDVAEADGRHFLSMEYVDGEDLASLLKRIGRLPGEKALDIARQTCAGLAAAHDLGILHRDFKPSNVMLDGRGRVRIMDFGLAVAAERLEGREAAFGAPAYMAPEQLEGEPVTARSDIYALGLVLYEVFTGQRVFPLVTVAEAQRLREESTPTRPRDLIAGFDPSVERAILSCLERDPALRPASARAVVAGLPGGDPIAVALVAGETPAPELVAAAGPEEGLTPAVATRTLAATLAMLVVLVVLSDRASILGWVPWTRSTDALEDNARQILTRLGHDATPVDRARLVVLTNLAYTRYVHAHDRSPDRWKALREPGQLAGLFFYRQGPRHLVPLDWHGRVTDIDPPPAAGEASLVTDLRGRLAWLQVVPDEAEPPAPSAPLPDWSRLFHEAGLELSRFRPAEPTRNPPVLVDARAAWTGVLDDFGGYPVRVEAASHRGKLVFFELVNPWDSYWDPALVEKEPAGPMTPALFAVVLLFALAVTGVLVVRNWLSGRGDRQGAFRIAAVVFFLRFAVWVLGGHHVTVLSGEWRLLIIALGKSLTDGALTWCIYLALEPYARRLHPRFLVSWTRLLRGRFRDPLVGRDILCGVAFSTIVILFWGQLYVIIPHALGLDAPPPPVLHPLGSAPYQYFLDAPPSQALLGGRYVVEALLARAFGAFMVTMMIALLGLRILLRKAWAALIVFVPLVSLLLWPAQLSDLNPIAMACAFAGTLAFVWALRFGLVGMLAIGFCLQVWMNFPVTGSLGAPHFGIGLVGVLAIAALAIYGALTASRPHRRALGDAHRLSAAQASRSPWP
jgi:hypothetical protein